MTPVLSGLQILLNYFSIVNIVYLFVALVFGMVAALNKEFFLYALGFLVMYLLILSKFTIFVHAIPTQFNSVLVFLDINYCVIAVVEKAFNHWHHNW